MIKNLASQKVVFQAIDAATGLPKTGDAANITAYLSKDDGTVTILGDTTATEMNATNAAGLYLFDLTQSETNADKLVFSGKSATANIALIPVVIYTRPANASLFAISGAGEVTVGTNNDKTGYTASSVSDKTGYALSVTPAVAGDAMTLTAGERTSIGTAVWSTTVRGLTTFGSLIADIWANATRTLSAFAFTPTPSNAAETTAIKAQTDLIPASPAAVGSAMTLNLSQAVPTSNTAETVGDSLNASRADAFGRAVISGTTLTLYAADGVTIVRTFTLDSATAPTTRT